MSFFKTTIAAFAAFMAFASTANAAFTQFPTVGDVDGLLEQTIAEYRQDYCQNVADGKKCSAVSNLHGVTYFHDFISAEQVVNRDAVTEVEGFHNGVSEIVRVREWVVKDDKSRKSTAWRIYVIHKGKSMISSPTRWIGNKNKLTTSVGVARYKELKAFFRNVDNYRKALHEQRSSYNYSESSFSFLDNGNESEIVDVQPEPKPRFLLAPSQGTSPVVGDSSDGDEWFTTPVQPTGGTVAITG